MKNYDSIHALDLSPKEGMVYKNFSRRWEEEIIYFLLVDRFHDGKKRVLQPGKGFGSASQLKGICGGNLKGIKDRLSYIKNLGCTAIWLSPVFENNPESYHGYAIQNFLKIDPRFGVEQDLIDLIKEAHEKEMKVILDCVLNHSGNNWSYKEEDCVYDEGKEYEFGEWQRNREPFPVELRDPDLYKRKGRIENWDEYPETQEGDFFSLKKFNHDEDEKGLFLQDVLFKIYAYWIKETDCDGIRIDAGKHLGQLPLARFSARIKQYAKSLGKEDFFIFAEIVGSDSLLKSFAVPSASKMENKVYEGADSFLDFSLHFLLPKVVEGVLPALKIFERYASLEKNLGPYKSSSFQLISFLDNHDQVEKPIKERIASRLNQEQLIAALGLLVTLPGVPCIYYGTEQGFTGKGKDDSCIREAMFDLNGRASCHLEGSFLYREIARLTELRKKSKALSLGAFLKLDAYKTSALRTLSEGIFFSRKYEDEELIVGYNPLNETINVFVIVLRETSKDGGLKFIYGLEGEIMPRFFKRNQEVFQLEIPPLKFLILK